MYKKILFIAIIFYIIFFSWFCFWKYFNFGYNGLDVAIYNQVFFNSVQGQLFQFTIHPQSYLGDHFELFILLLLPFYYLFQSPLTLLFLQTVFLAMTAWPIFLITKKLINEKIALLAALIWLFNPFVQNINLFEFHLLPFALFFIFFAFYFYQEKKFWLFLIFLIISLTIREDVALVTLMFGFLALIERKNIKWILTPIIISGVWLIIAFKLIALFAPTGQYKFLFYYSWLGSNIFEIIKNFFFQPLLVLKHLFTWQNIFFILGLFLPFGYLIIFQSKYLLLGILALIQILLTGGDNTLIALETHYATLFLPMLFLMLIFEIKKILTQKNLNKSRTSQRGIRPCWKVRDKLEKFLAKESTLTFGILIAITLYSSLLMGPVLGFFQKNFDQTEINNKKLFLNQVNPAESVATTFEFLTILSSRSNLYSLHYAYLGKEQFALKDYQLPADTEKILADTTDFLSYQLLFPNIKNWDSYNESGDNRLREFIKTNQYQVKMVNDTLVLWQKPASSKAEGLAPSEVEGNVEQPILLYQLNPDLNQIENKQNKSLSGKIKFFGWDNQGYLNNNLNLSFYFQALTPIKENYNIRLIIQNQNNQLIFQKDYPMAYGLYPTTDWQAGEVIKINYFFLLPANLDLANKKISLEILEQKGFLTLNKIRQIVHEIMKKNSLGQFVITL